MILKGDRKVETCAISMRMSPLIDRIVIMSIPTHVLLAFGCRYHGFASQAGSDPTVEVSVFYPTQGDTVVCERREETLDSVRTWE